MKNKQICIILIAMLLICSGCNKSPAPNPTPQITDEVYVTVTPKPTEPLETPWRVPTYPPSPTAKPTVTPTPSPTPVPPTPTVNPNTLYKYGLQQESSYYYNVKFIQYNESKFVKSRESFSSEKEFYDYIFNYSEQHVREIIDSLNDSTRFYMMTLMGYPNNNKLNDTWMVDYERRFYFVLDDANTMNTIKSLLANAKFERVKDYKYYEEIENPGLWPSGGEFGTNISNNNLHLFYVPETEDNNPAIWEDCMSTRPIVRKGFGITYSTVFYRFGNGIVDCTLEYKFNEQEKKIAADLIERIQAKMGEKITEILNSSLSNPILDMG